MGGIVGMVLHSADRTEGGRVLLPCSMHCWFWCLLMATTIVSVFTIIFIGQPLTTISPLHGERSPLSRDVFSLKTSLLNFRNSSMISFVGASRMVLPGTKYHALTQQSIQVTPILQIPEDLPPQEAKQLAREAFIERSFYQLRETKVNPFLHDFVIAPNNFCFNDTFLVILIHSYHNHEERRQAIRETWGSVSKGSKWPRRDLNVSVRIAYVLGRHFNDSLNNRLRSEAEVHNDIIQGSFIDSYSNLTLKSVLGLRYFSRYCAEAKYYLKTDDDVFINIPFWVEILQHTPMYRSIMGVFHSHSKVFRSGRWGVSHKDYPFEYYTPYEMGLAYVIDGGLVGELVNASEYVPPIPIEDAYVTGILGRILNVTHVVLKGPHLWQYNSPKSCEISGNITLVGHELAPVKIHGIWKDLIDGVGPCPEMDSEDHL